MRGSRGVDFAWSNYEYTGQWSSDPTSQPFTLNPNLYPTLTLTSARVLAGASVERATARASATATGRRAQETARAREKATGTGLRGNEGGRHRRGRREKERYWSGKGERICTGGGRDMDWRNIPKFAVSQCRHLFLHPLPLHT